MTGSMDEKVFKISLLKHILSQNNYKLICTEIPFLSLGRFVDVLQITQENELIAYEIKSDKDTLKRLDGQLDDYCQTFNKVYVIMSDKFKNHAKALPKNVGYGFIKNGEIIIQREAKSKKRLSKWNLSMFLWRRDLRKYQQEKNQCVGETRAYYIEQKKQDEIKDDAIEALLGRYDDVFDKFMQNKHCPLNADDLDLFKRW